MFVDSAVGFILQFVIARREVEFSGERPDRRQDRIPLGVHDSAVCLIPFDEVTDGHHEIRIEQFYFFEYFFKNLAGCAAGTVADHSKTENLGSTDGEKKNNTQDYENRLVHGASFLYRTDI